MHVAVEVCVTSVEEALAAEAAGADSVEVCSWLACGGITPSSGLVDAVRSAIRIPARVLLRPMPSGFIHAPPALHALFLDAEIFGGGAIGLVTGGLTATGGMDRELIRSVKQLAPESEISFHRAIDHANDPLEVLDGCLALGVDRILTSGQATLALDGVALIKQLVIHATDQLTIAAAGGIGPLNAVELVERTGVQEVHFAAQLSVDPHAMGKAAMSSSNAGISFATAPDHAKIEGVMNALVKAGLR